MHSVSGSIRRFTDAGSRVWYENKSRRTTVRWGINIKCFRHSGEGHAQRPSKRRSSERTIAAVGQTRSKWRAISSGKAARIKGTPEVDLELARRSSRQTGVPGREMEKILWIARETQ
jgi:hypothetical protein